MACRDWRVLWDCDTTMYFYCKLFIAACLNEMLVKILEDGHKAETFRNYGVLGVTRVLICLNSRNE
jgi:hypothetical protein